METSENKTSILWAYTNTAQTQNLSKQKSLEPDLTQHPYPLSPLKKPKTFKKIHTRSSAKYLNENVIFIPLPRAFRPCLKSNGYDIIYIDIIYLRV